jgi:hypothetical protein
MSKGTDPFVAGHRLLLVSINRTIEDRGVYDATRYAWRVSRKKAEEIDLVLGCANGVVEGVYVPEIWLDASPGTATKNNFPGFIATHSTPRLGFEGRDADPAIKEIYLGKRVPENLAIGQAGFRYFFPK